MQRAIGLHHLAQRAVYPKSHTRMPLVRLDVNVAGAVARGLGQERVQHANNRRIVRGVKQVGNRGQLLHDARQVSVGFNLVYHRRRAGFAF